MGGTTGRGDGAKNDDGSCGGTCTGAGQKGKRVEPSPGARGSNPLKFGLGAEVTNEGRRVGFPEERGGRVAESELGGFGLAEGKPVKL